MNGDYLTVLLFPAEVARDDALSKQKIYHLGLWFMLKKLSEKLLTRDNHHR